MTATFSPGAAVVRHTEVLIIGAGPFGLAAAAHLRRCGIDHLVVGEPMSFWRAHMPKGMCLRSNAEWHFDVGGTHTIDAYFRAAGITPEGVDPLPLDVYLDYCDWFCERAGVTATPGSVQRLDYDPGSQLYTAHLAEGCIAARNVVVAVGMGYFAHVPDDLAAVLPGDRVRHTRDAVDLDTMAGRRVLIIGGRQSAFESAALLRESGAEAVYLSYRHETPRFEQSHWSWVQRLVSWMALDPGWYRRLNVAEKEELSQLLWFEGRAKLEPWLAPRIAGDEVKLFPRTCVLQSTDRSDGTVDVRLSDGSTTTVDEILMATGYRTDIRRVPFLDAGNILPLVETRDDLPVLDERMQSSLPGLFFTSSLAAGSFGPVFGFTVAVRASAELLGAGLSSRIHGGRNRGSASRAA